MELSAKIFKANETGTTAIEADRSQLGMTGKSIIVLGYDLGNGEFDHIEMESFASANTALTSYGLPTAENIQDAAQRLVNLRNNPPQPPEPAPSADERIAAALEFQSMMLL